MDPTAKSPKSALRVIAALAAVAVLCSGYLLYQSVSGDYNPCCGHVLDTRWAKWFGIPVSAFAVALYLAILATALAAGRSAKASHVLLGAGMLAGGTALWFFAVLIFIEKATCPYCIATHMCGLGIAGTLIAIRRKLPLAGAAPFAGACAALVAVIAGQMLGGGSGEVEFSDSAGAAPAKRSSADTLVFTDQIKLKLGEFPMVGPEKPTHYIAEIFDYTCKSCRDVYGDFKALEEAHPGVFTFIYLPAPLNRRCNSYVPSEVHDHQHACELARTALAVWAADPSKFPEYHDSLMTRPLPIRPLDAEAKAISLVGKEAFEKAQRSPALERSLQTALGHYSSTVSSNIKMPKVLIGEGLMMHGFAPSTQAFVTGMAKRFLLE